MFNRRKKAAKTAKKTKPVKAPVEVPSGIVDCSNCNKKFVADGNPKCVACRQV